MQGAECRSHNVEKGKSERTPSPEEDLPTGVNIRAFLTLSRCLAMLNAQCVFFVFFILSFVRISFNNASVSEFKCRLMYKTEQSLVEFGAQTTAGLARIGFLGFRCLGNWLGIWQWLTSDLSCG